MLTGSWFVVSVILFLSDSIFTFENTIHNVPFTPPTERHCRVTQYFSARSWILVVFPALVQHGRERRRDVMEADVPGLSLPGVARLLRGASRGLASDHSGGLSIPRPPPAHRGRTPECASACTSLCSPQYESMIMFMILLSHLQVRLQMCKSFFLLLSPVYMLIPHLTSRSGSGLFLPFSSFSTFSPQFFPFPLLKVTANQQPLCTVFVFVLSYYIHGSYWIHTAAKVHL